jgi:hypothetical protein
MKGELPPCAVAVDVAVAVAVGTGTGTGTGTGVAASIRKRHDGMPLVITIDLRDDSSEYRWRIVEPLTLLEAYLRMQK